MGVHRVRPHAELVKVRFPSNDGPCRLELIHNCRVKRAGEFVQDARGTGGRKIARADVVLN